MGGELQQIMNQNILLKKQNSLSSLYSKVKQVFGMRKTARFWFASLLSQAEDMEPAHLHFDCSKQQYEQLLRMLNYVVCDLTSFYIQNPPEQVYKLLHVARTIFDLGPRDAASQFQGYHLTMYQVHFNNILAMFLIKNAKYSSAYECYEFVMDIVRNDTVDTRADIFLVSLSNYLCFIKVHQYLNVSRRIAELMGCLENVYKGLLDKYIAFGCAEDSLVLMLSVFKQHEANFSRNFASQNQLLIGKYESSQAQNKPGRENFNDNKKIEYLCSRNKASKITDIEVKKKQLSFFIPSTFSVGSSLKKKKSSVRQTQQSINQLPFSTSTNRTLIPQDSDSNIKQFHIGSGKKNSINLEIVSKTIQIGEMKDIAAAAYRPRSRLLKSDKKQASKQPKRKRVYYRNQSIVFKINYSLMQITLDGIIFSDFLQQRKKFTTWAQVFSLLKNLRYSFVFQQSMPISNFYDIARILSAYIYKSDTDRRGLLLSQTPKQLIQLNVLTKLFASDGPYLKFCIMNQYDVSRAELHLDCYLSEFMQLFKSVNKNEYIQMLNNKVFKLEHKEAKMYSIEVWKRKSEEIVEQLSCKLKAENIIDVSQLKNSAFRIIMQMPNNVTILCYLQQYKEQEQPESMSINMRQIGAEHHQTYGLQVPLYKVQRLFAMHSSQVNNWMKKYGKIIMQCYETSFLDFPSSFKNLQFFNAITYARKTQMMKVGKYCMPVIAEIIGSKKRIYGLSIRLYEQTKIKQTVTFIYNPYFQLLAPLIGASPEQRTEILNQHLVNQSVVETYRKLTECKLLGKMVNLVEYWAIIDF